MNLPLRQLEIYREPGFLGYITETILKSGQPASPAKFPDVMIEMEEWL